VVVQSRGYEPSYWLALHFHPVYIKYKITSQYANGRVLDPEHSRLFIEGLSQDKLPSRFGPTDLTMYVPSLRRLDSQFRENRNELNTRNSINQTLGRSEAAVKWKSQYVKVRN